MVRNSIKEQFLETWISTLFSVALLTGVSVFIIWTEHKNIESSRKLEDLLKSARTLNINHDERLAYNGEASLIVGPLQIKEPLSEPDYGIHVQAVKLKKRVQMYQWFEEVSDSSTFTGADHIAEESDKTYWYFKDWYNYPVDSSSFYRMEGHKNPTSFPFNSEMHIAENVNIGWVGLGYDLKRQVSDFYDITSDNRPERSDILLHSGMYYHGDSALEHEIGDLRVTFQYAGREDDIYTAVGILENGILQPYFETPDSEGVSLLRKGSFTSEMLLSLEARERRIRLWKYRILGFVQIFAVAMTLHPNWLTLLLKSRFATRRLQHNSRLWTNIVLSFSYTFIISSLPWLRPHPNYGLALLGTGLLPLTIYFQMYSDGRRVGNRRGNNENGPQHHD